jgi:hypothetical protein
MTLTPLQALKICERVLAEAKSYPPTLAREAEAQARGLYRVCVGKLQRERGTIRLGRRKRA